MDLRKLLAGLPVTIETVVSMTVTVLLIAAFDPTPGLLVLGAVLAMTLSRSKLIDTWRGRLESVIVLPVLAIVTSGVALLLALQPLIGAIAFTAAMFLSVWLRRFGATWQRIGSLVALPFITLLIAPVHLGGNAAPRAAVVSVLALVVVVAVRVAGDAAGRLAQRRTAGGRPSASQPTIAPADGPKAVAPQPATTLKPIPSTRMAIQLAAAIAAAFALGFWLFPEHWGWVVLTAYLVNAGNRGRADVLYKSGLRVVGAAAGSLAAIAVAGVHTSRVRHWSPS